MKNYTILFSDMDWCLISTKSGHLFPQSWDDYVVDKQVASQIKKLNPKMILLVSNQSGVGDKSQHKKFMTKENFEKRINSIMSELNHLTGIPVYGTYCASGDKKNPMRKPNPGMCQQMMDKYCPDESKENMLMIGDASGLKGDWADTDKKCAENFGIDYMDVDEFANRKHRDDKFKNIEEATTIKGFIEITENMKDLKDVITESSKDFGRGMHRTNEQVEASVNDALKNIKSSDDKKAASGYNVLGTLLVDADSREQAQMIIDMIVKSEK